MKKLSRLAGIGLVVALICGFVLRLIWTEDMEYKEDEEYNYLVSQIVGTKIGWPWLGMPSGVYIPNPGMSIWVFAWIARLFRAHDPVTLARAVSFVSWIGIASIIPFAVYFVQKTEPGKVATWLWASAIALVNPFAVFYQRKLWPEPILPVFTVATLAGWWCRDKFWYAFAWGFLGAALGQIHMGGFFFAAALFLWTLLFGEKRSTHWRGWFAGSVLATLPLIPWFFHIFTQPTGGAIKVGLDEILQFKFWAFWFTDPTGLHLGNPLGLLRGPSNWDQISDFVRYPIIGGHATYLTGLAHLLLGALLLGTFSFAVFNGLKKVIGNRRIDLASFTGRGSPSLLLQNAALIGFGLLLTVTGVVIRRYYLMVALPLEFFFFVQIISYANSSTYKRLNSVLAAIWFCEFFISASFVGYVHVHNGATQGDYGEAYHVVRESGRSSLTPTTLQGIPADVVDSVTNAATHPPALQKNP